MKKIFFIIMIMAFNHAFSQQKYFTRQGHVSFFSEAPLQKIEAHNYQVSSFLSTDGEIVFSILIKGFEFEKQKMQDDFNANYMESDKYPKATFDGKITNINQIDFKKDGAYKAEVEGKMTIHGVTKDIKCTGSLQIQGEKIITSAKFSISVKDYGIKIPTIVVQKIAEVVEVTVNLTYEPYQK
jgi:hypothetical protein